MYLLLTALLSLVFLPACEWPFSKAKTTMENCGCDAQTTCDQDACAAEASADADMAQPASMEDPMVRDAGVTDEADYATSDKQ